MQKKEEAIPLRRVCANLREGDFEWLKDNSGKLTPSGAIRELVSKHRRNVEAKAEQRLKGTYDLDLNLEDVIE